MVICYGNINISESLTYNPPNLFLPLLLLYSHQFLFLCSHSFLAFCLSSYIYVHLTSSSSSSEHRFNFHCRTCRKITILFMWSPLLSTRWHYPINNHLICIFILLCEFINKCIDMLKVKMDVGKLLCDGWIKCILMNFFGYSWTYQVVWGNFFQFTKILRFNQAI